ncbi:hypothetical protein N7478_007746 [Penicillium angulare]|uniref:uncharacterized protein n=1 Tax=Penicillium angulare TaxID=116970 RepID=UPI002541F357|nr:uncharacterized protein N7478_007746 [Penicillium angulare]KAJ5272621.1 hypothetical protein N7478_007746 [Penicillium angulare]
MNGVQPDFAVFSDQKRLRGSLADAGMPPDVLRVDGEAEINLLLEYGADVEWRFEEDNYDRYYYYDGNANEQYTTALPHTFGLSIAPQDLEWKIKPL